MMYCRPGNLLKDIFVERQNGTINSGGRAQTQYDSSGSRLIKAVLAEAKPEEKERWRQLQHPVTHTIIQKGKAVAAVGDRLVSGARAFYVQGADDIGALGMWTIYYVEERADVNGRNKLAGG